MLSYLCYNCVIHTTEIQTMTTTTTSVGFTIHGDFMTDHFRNLVREGNWRQALENTMDGLIGMTSEYAGMILAGKAALEGVNSVEFVEDNKHEDPEWVKKHYFTYTYNLIAYKGKIYEKYRNVEALYEEDSEKAKVIFDWRSIPVGDKKAVQQFSYDRARTYMENMYEDIVLYDVSGGWTLFRRATPDYPSWLKRNEFLALVENKTPDNIEQLVKESNEVAINDREFRRLYTNDEETIENTQTLETFFKQEKEVETALEDLDALRERIKAVADKHGGWLAIKDRAGKKTYTIPKNPFLRWCLSDSPLYKTIKWSAISPRGMKMGQDDPNHTDWWLFTGLPMSEANNHDSQANRIFFKERYRMHEEMTGSNLKYLINSNHSGLNNVLIIRIEDPKSDTYIPEKAIIVIPNASPDFEMIAKKAADRQSIVITQAGGALCHLATVGREFALQLYLLPDAEKILCGSTFASIDTHNHQLSVSDYQGPEFEMLIRRKMAGIHYR